MFKKINGFWGIPVNQPDQPFDEVLSDAAKWQLLQCRPKGLRVFGHLRRYVDSSPMGKDRLPTAIFEGVYLKLQGCRSVKKGF